MLKIIYQAGTFLSCSLFLSLNYKFLFTIHYFNSFFYLQLFSCKSLGLRVGYNTSSGEHSVSAELFKNTDKLSQVAMLYEAAEVSAKGQLIISSEQGNLEIISSKMRFNKAQVKVKGIHIDAKDNQVTQQHTSTRMSVGIHVGVQ